MITYHFSLSQVDPELAPCAEFILLAEVVPHLLGGVASRQGTAIIAVLVVLHFRDAHC